MKVLHITFILGIPLLVSACCPIPFPTKKLLMPEGVIHVQELNQTAKKHQPVSDATIRISRGVRNPHPGPISHEWTFKTDNKGIVKTKAKSHREATMPLMMHGVPFYYWRLCVSKPGYTTTFVDWSRETSKPVPQTTVTLQLGKHTPCPDKSMEPTPNQINIKRTKLALPNDKLK